MADAVDERLAPDDPDVAVLGGLRQHVLAAAKTDLQPDRPLIAEQHRQIQRPPIRILSPAHAPRRDPVERRLKMFLLPFAQFFPMATAVEIAPRGAVFAVGHGR